MKGAIIIVSIVMLLGVTATSSAQQAKADEPTEVIGRICKTMEQHPPPTADADYGLLDYAVCGQGGLRVHSNERTREDFAKIKCGTMASEPGRELVYLRGYMRTIVLPSFGTKDTPAWHPRFRFSWLDVDEVRRGISFHGKPRVKRSGGTLEIAVDITNPLDKPIANTDVTVTLKSMQYPRPITKKLPMLDPGKKETVMFTLPLEGPTPKGMLVISNYGRVYIDIEEEF